MCKNDEERAKEENIEEKVEVKCGKHYLLQEHDHYVQEICHFLIHLLTRFILVHQKLHTPNHKKNQKYQRLELFLISFKWMTCSHIWVSRRFSILDKLEISLVCTHSLFILMIFPKKESYFSNKDLNTIDIIELIFNAKISNFIFSYFIPSYFQNTL